MTTYEVTDEQIEEVKARLERLKVLADGGDDVAQVALDAVSYAQVLQLRIQELEKSHGKLAELVLIHADTIERIVNVLKAMDMTVPLPDCPDDIPGYG